MKKKLIIGGLCLTMLFATGCASRPTDTENAEVTISQDPSNGMGFDVAYNKETGECHIVQTVIMEDDLTVTDDEMKNLLNDIFSYDLSEGMASERVAHELSFLKACTNEDGTIENRDMIIENLNSILEEAKMFSETSAE